MISLVIAGVDCTALLLVATASVQKTIKGRSTASFQLFDRGQTFRPQRGWSVELTDELTTFTGQIDKISETRFEGILDVIQYQISCLDFACIFDHRVVSRRYPAGSITKNMIQDIVDSFLIGEGFNYDHVDGFAMISSEMEFDYRSVTECFDMISEASGEDWFVRGKDLYFKSLVAMGSAPFNISDTSANWRSLTVDYERSTSYRNKEYLRTKVQMVTGTITQSFTANGTQSFFPTSFVLSDAPTMTVNSVSQPMFVAGVDAPFQSGYYWFAGGGGVYQGQSAPPAAGALVELTYGGYDSGVVTAQDDAQIAERAAVEGGSGIWEYLDEANDIDALDTAQQVCQGILDHYKVLPVTIRYETDMGGLQPGQKQIVDLAANDLSSATFYVTQVASKAIESATPDRFPGGGYFFRHTVTLALTQDQFQGNWIKWWEQLWSRIKMGRTEGLGGLPTLAVTPLDYTFVFGASKHPVVPTDGDTTNAVAVMIDGNCVLWKIAAATAPTTGDASFDIVMDDVSLWAASPFVAVAVLPYGVRESHGITFVNKALTKDSVLQGFCITAAGATGISIVIEAQ